MCRFYNRLYARFYVVLPPWGRTVLIAVTFTLSFALRALVDSVIETVKMQLATLLTPVKVFLENAVRAWGDIRTHAENRELTLDFAREIAAKPLFRE